MTKSIQCEICEELIEGVQLTNTEFRNGETDMWYVICSECYEAAKADKLFRSTHG